MTFRAAVFALVVGGGLLGTTTGIAEVESKCQVKLSIRADTLTVRPNYELRVSGTLENVGTDFVRLVDAGDGSLNGMRTPILRWEVTPLDGQEPEPGPLYRCASMNGVEAGELFTLHPGQRHVLTGWYRGPRAAQPGRYRAVLTYTNDPALIWYRELEDRPRDEAAEWQLVRTDVHAPEIMARVHASTPCQAVSNAIEFEVQP